MTDVPLNYTDRLIIKLLQTQAMSADELVVTEELSAAKLTKRRAKVIRQHYLNSILKLQDLQLVKKKTDGRYLFIGMSKSK